MKKIIFILLFALSSVFVNAQYDYWDITFHPGDKMGLPDRYACIYNEYDYTIMFRSDIDPVKIIINNKEFDYTVTKYGMKYADMTVELFSNQHIFSSSYTVQGEVEKNIMILHDINMINWIMNGGCVRLSALSEGKKISLKIEAIDLINVKNANLMYHNDL